MNNNINPLLKYVMKEKKENVVHSSAYGRLQNKAGMGSASTESFLKRMSVEQNRTMVNRYGSSKVAGSGINNGPKAKAYVPPKRDIAINRSNVIPKNRGISR